MVRVLFGPGLDTCEYSRITGIGGLGGGNIRTLAPENFTKKNSASNRRQKKNKNKKFEKNNLIEIFF